MRHVWEGHAGAQCEEPPAGWGPRRPRVGRAGPGAATGGWREGELRSSAIRLHRACGARATPRRGPLVRGAYPRRPRSLPHEDAGNPLRRVAARRCAPPPRSLWLSAKPCVPDQRCGAALQPGAVPRAAGRRRTTSARRGRRGHSWHFPGRTCFNFAVHRQLDIRNRSYCISPESILSYYASPNFKTEESSARLDIRVRLALDLEIDTPTGADSFRNFPFRRTRGGG